MKLRSALVAVAASMAVSAPVAAHAATYEPYTADDPAYDASTAPKEPVNAGIDQVKVRATRTDTTFAISVTYRNFQRASYSRRIVSLQDDDDRTRAVEYRTAGPGSTPKVTFYKNSPDNKRIIPFTCSGVRTTVNEAKERLTFVIPAACYPGATDTTAAISAISFKWSADTWTPGSFGNDQQQQPDQIDVVDDEWTWTEL